MTILVASLGTGKGTWGHVGRLVNEGEWEKIILVTNDFGKLKFNAENKNLEFVVIDPNQTLGLLTENISKALKEKVDGTEVALNLISGTGKEHMALLSAILKLGLGIRFYAITKDGIVEI